MTETMTEAERFFYDHAGSSYDPRTETEDEGRVRGARVLAAAEERIKAGPYFISVEPDPEPWDADVEWDGPVYVVSLCSVVDSTDSYVIGSLGQVACESESDPYIRVVSAELASEWIPK